MTLDASGVETGAKQAETALNGISSSAEKTGETSERSFDALLAPLERISKQLSRMGASLSELTGLSRQNGAALADLGNKLSNIGTTAGKAEKSSSDAGKALKDTEGDVLDFTAAAVRSSQRMAELSQELQNLTAYKKALEQNGFGLGFQDYDQTVARMQQIKAEQKDYQAALSKPVTVQVDSTQADSLSVKLKQAKADLASLEGAGFGLGDTNYDAQYQEVARLTQAVRDYKAELTAGEELGFLEQYEVQLKNAVGITDQIKGVFSSIGTAASKMAAGVMTGVLHPIRAINVALGSLGSKAGQVFSGVAATVKTALTNGLQLAGRGVTSFAGKLLGMAPGISILKGIADRLRGVRSGGDGANLGLTKMVRSVRNIGLVSVGLKLVSSLFGRLRSVVSQYLTENTAAQAAVNNLKSAFANALAPAINIAINALNAILPYIQAVSNAFATLFTNLFGAQWTTISGGVSGAADAVDGVAGATKDATAAQEEYNRSLAGFDQITKLDDNSGAGGSGGSGGGGGTSTSTTGGGTGMLGQFSDFMTQLAGLVKNGAWADLGAFLAESFGSAIDTLYGVLTSAETYAKIDSAVTALGATVNSFFARMTLIDEGTGDTIAEKTGMTLGAAVNLAFYTANSVLTSIDWDSIGLTIAQMINGAVEETDFGQIGTTVANYFLTLPKILYSTVVNTDWGAVAGGLSESLISAFSTISSWVKSVDWSQIGTAIEDALARIDWAGIASSLFDLLGSTFGALGSVIGQLAADAMNSIGDYFSEWIDWGLENGPYEDIGSNILYGIFAGIGNAIQNVGAWIVDNIFTPFIDGFKSAFGIHSPASAPELVSAAGNVGLGILNAIGSVFTNVGDWVQKNILTPVSNAVSGAKTATLEFTANVKNDASAWWSNVKTWWGQKAGAVSSFATGVANGAATWWSNVKTWWGQKAGAVSSFATGVANGAATWWSNVKTWWGQKAGNVASFATSVTNQASTWWSNVKSWWSGKAGSVASFKTGVTNSAATWWSNVKSWWSSKSKTGVSVKANVTKGWTGSVLSKLGLNNLSSKFSIKLPTVKVTWSGSPIKLPKFSIKWNAQGGILDGATLFGMAGNTLLGGGEAGREAILPLDRNTDWMDKVADRVAQRVSGGSSSAPVRQPLVLNVYVGEERLVTKVIDGINDIIDRTGTVPIRI